MKSNANPVFAKQSLRCRRGASSSTRRSVYRRKNELCGGVLYFLPLWPLAAAGNTKGGSITVPLTSSLTGLD